ncbi:MAG: Bax inhibitor-1 family protein [Planctomycetaceae bacterium]|jgi:FtsH-binding integral membrane protein|nr:Bax inhibitor-1 family protein [Planctomycetaceae bacterium]
MRYNQVDNELYNNDNYAADLFAAAAAADERSSFITKTYLYLFGAVAALIGIECVLFTACGMDRMMQVTQRMCGGDFSWIIVLGAFMAVSWIANAWAMNAASSAMQHAGLALYVAAQSVILIPLLCLAQLKTGDTSLIVSAGMATAGLFALLTATVFMTRKDFSFLRGICIFGGLAALGFLIVAPLCGFAIGPVFTYLMIALACCYILYDTSNVLHHYRIGQHVAASLALFASVVILFWYILRLFMSNRD